MEFLVKMVFSPPEGTTESERAGLIQQEGTRSAELARLGHIQRLWRPTETGGLWQNVGLWRADNEAELREVIASLPLAVWLTAEITGLLVHPNDPGAPWRDLPA
jgi:muconolactone delta-isomerase